MTRLAIHGAAGRMGRRLVALAHEDGDLAVAAGVEASGHPALGQDIGELAAVGAISVPLSSQLPSDGVDVLIDFSAPAPTRIAIDACTESGIKMVIGTTGLSDEDQDRIDRAGQSIAILQAPNMSLGVNLLFALVADVARRLGDEYDIEIVEAHHRFKVDAPSGTAVRLAEVICDATNKDMSRDVVYDRHGEEVPRKRGQIGMHALRLGDVVGRHSVSFATPGEEIQITHVATTRDVFARGALRAAKWLADRPPGRYRLSDVLELDARGNVGQE